MTDIDPDVTELIRSAIDSRLLDVNVCLPGIVVSYDAATQTCEVRPAVKRPLDTDSGEVVHEEIKPIQNVPVAFPGGGNFSQHFALAAGDTVLLVFSQWSFAQWRQTGVVSEAGDLRMHAPAYPVAFPWYRPQGKPAADTGNTQGVPGGLRLHFGASAIGVGGQADFVAMAAKVDARLGALESAMNSHTHVVATTGTAAAQSGTAAAAAGAVTPGASTASTNLKAD